MIRVRVVLSCLTDEMWTQAKKSCLINFIKSNTHKLIIFIHKTKNKLKLVNDMPRRDITDQIAYFITDPNGPQLMPVNFMELVQCGCLRTSNPVHSLLKNLTGTTVPMATVNKSWSDGVRNEFLADLHKFMSVLTDNHWRNQSKTILYIPINASNMPASCSADKELVRRLQGWWTKNYHLMITFMLQILYAC